MTKEEKIKAIYEKIADKTLSFGCWVMVDKFVSKRQICTIVYRDDKNDMDYFYTKEKWNVYIEDIIWHPVMIWDVLDYIEDKWEYNWEMWDILALWILKRKPIEEQSEECIDYVFNLLPKE